MKFYWCILLLLLTSLPSMSQTDHEPYHGDGPDDVLRLLPAASVVVLKACGVPSRNSWCELAVKGGSAMLLTTGSTLLLKHVVHERRPDGTGNDAFPSGHAAIAFCGATVLHKEYGHLSPWLSVAGYSVATLTALDRVRRNRHDWVDVGAGAAIGVLSTELTYWLGNHLLHRSDVDVTASPTMLCVVWHL